MPVPILAVEAFHEVIRAFKNDPIYIDEEQAKFFEKQVGFIPVAGYCEWMVVKGEIGVLDNNRLVVKKQNEKITRKPNEA